MTDVLDRVDGFFGNLRMILLAALGLLVITAGFLIFTNECAVGGGMGTAYRTCDCAGVEWVLFDHTAADGPRKSVCLGIVRSRTCYGFMGGPRVECPG